VQFYKVRLPLSSYPACWQ